MGSDTTEEIGMRTRITALLTSAFVLLLPALALAAEETGAAGEKQTKSWWDLFQQTGIVGILLAVLSMLGTTLLLQYYFRYRERRLGDPEFLKRVEKLLIDGEADAAYEAALAEDTYAGRVLAGALRRRSAGYNEVKDSLIEASGVETFRINAKVSYLSLVGNIGPLLGLLGTVTGMIRSFQQIEQLAAPTPADLAKGVYESLVNTTIGLFIAIVFLSAYFFMKNKISDITLRINTEIANVLSNAFVLEPTEGAEHN